MIDKTDYNILIVEDDIINSEFIKKTLLSLGFNNLHHASNADKSIEIVKTNKIDMAFMDINIDGSIDGINCAHIINKIQNIPIVYTTAYSDTNTIIEANDTNICGFLIKPFDRKDIEANLYIALKKTSHKSIKNKTKSSLIRLSSQLKYDLEKSILYDENNTVDLTNKEKSILHLLCKNIDSDISYENLKENIWNTETSDSTIRDTIFRLRKKIPALNIKSVSGIGYKLKKYNDD